ncbi:PREDICTED: uncharacterized protein LOC105969840 [Erythranthe guttata]|uniref:uncharacterized protein LOC105969840 n=1 Tax=Erythranthe guttata TaxID=4155 RepID=UPI00064D9670|nr:PREDICTED: uncharacterized protein LOC105969840 [Erythranthe guttata]|eukprot:XP_012850072.1 PREDICTED: uncharacterized protein LOC105969840 [Erythranthe guttata]
MGKELQRCLAPITDEQTKVYDVFMDVVSNDRGRMFFLYGHGGTGKTFLWKTLSAAVCSNITQQSPQVELLIRTKLIMWNEASMMHMNCFEALDEIMKSVLQVDKPFGGKVVVLGGDIRQILPVVLKASRQDIVHATVNSSPLWHFYRVMKLSKNMRLQSCYSPSNVVEVIEFGDWILKVGNGDVREQNDGEASLEIPEDMLIGDSEDLFRDLLNFVYPDLLSNMYDPDYFQRRAILAPTNECVESVSDYLMSLLPGVEKVYLTSDSMCRDEQTTEDNAKIYSTELLNTIRCSRGFFSCIEVQGQCTSYANKKHRSSRGLCNGTRLQIIIIGIHVLYCKLLFGENISDIVFIPRMTLIPSNSGLSIKLQRRQFPLIVSFAMTINKNQGQTLSHVGLYLPRPLFSHGQLYVALSRVKSRGGIKIFIKWDSGELTDVTRNVVYKEVFHRI